MTILLTGGDGYLGWPTALRIASRTDDRVILVDNFGRREWVEEVGATSATPVASIDERLDAAREVHGLSNISFVEGDLAEKSVVDELLTVHEPDVVVNCAAMTDVDGCERDPEGAQLLNGDAPGGLAAHCAAHNVEFVHISTDYVFDGTARDPYAEEATPNPVQAYGKSKLDGERAVRSESEHALIARLSFVWGIHRSTGNLTGFPAWVRDQLRSDEAVPLFTDQWVTPKRAGQAADTLLDLIARE